MSFAAVPIQIGDAAKKMGSAKKRTLAERYLMVQDYENSGMELSRYMVSKGWLASRSFCKEMCAEQKDFLKWVWKAESQDWAALYMYVDEEKGHFGKEYMEKHKRLPAWWNGMQKMQRRVLEEVCLATLQEAVRAGEVVSNSDLNAMVDKLVKNMCDGIVNKVFKGMDSNVEKIGMDSGLKRKSEDCSNVEIPMVAEGISTKLITMESPGKKR